MGSGNNMPEVDSVYLDELTLPAAWRLLRIKGLSNVTVLEVIRPRQKLWCWLLKRKGVHVVESSFFAGNLKTADGESVIRVSNRVSSQIALIAAKEIVQSESTLHKLNEVYGRNTIRLFIVKQLHLHIVYWTSRALVADALCATGRPEVWLKKPNRFDGKLLREALPGVNLRFYLTVNFWPIKLAMAWIIDVARNIKLILGTGKSNKPSPSDSTTPRKPSVLTLQEDNIHADRSLRGQPHWVDVNDPPEIFDTYVLEHQSAIFAIAKDTSALSKAGVKVLSTSAFRSALYAMRNNKVFIQIRRDRRTVIQAVFKVGGFANKHSLLRVAFLLRQAELMGALALWLNAKVFLIRETYYSLADAMQLVAPALNITTLAYQYSNLGSISPIMMTTADKFLIFSDIYKAIYQTEGITPQEFLPTGYLYDGVANLVRERARKNREALSRAGAKFIVCYFDESVQHDRWGLVSKGDHLGELHVLAKTIISDPTFGVVVKSQFMFNSPTRLYPKDEIIRAATATGRYLELMEGIYRNNIYPTEAALVADLCISHKFGATAALESAIAGVRTVLLDIYGTKTPWDAVYSQADIEYETIDSLMDAIARYRNGNVAEQKLGDWTPILHYFDPYRDGKAVERLCRQISVSI